MDPLAEVYSMYSPYAYVGNDPISFADPTGMYRVDAAGNINITDPDEIAKALGYISSGGFSFANFSSYIKDEANGFRYELDHVEINPVSLANESYTDGQNIASDRYSSTNGNVNVGGIAHSFKTVSNGERALNGIQTGLDLLGMVPVFGEFADGFNAFLYAGRGDYVNASLSASAMVPFAGWASTSLKLGGKAAKGGQTVIGEGMKRVSTEAAKREGSVILNNMPNFTGTADQVTSQMMTFNRQWLLQQMRSGRPIIDIGLDPARGVPSIFYQMEQNMIKNYLKLHPNAFQVIKP